jgi:hypothetical protein
MNFYPLLLFITLSLASMEDLNYPRLAEQVNIELLQIYDDEIKTLYNAIKNEPNPAFHCTYCFHYSLLIRDINLHNTMLL